ncbi:MAG: peptidyl-prolyl cis-trans isomerase [Verrucomicrobiales bacterium]|jgi:peptidyl-prolyl cis-trans isomerase C|nr:peptidyl-prolyl cis-trans isomerase [Verrucomicrobiales bacterium]
MKILPVISTACLAALVACSPKDPKNPNFVVASFKGGKITRAELTAKENEVAASRGINLADLPAEVAARVDWDVANRLALEKILANKTAQLKNKIQSVGDAELAEAREQLKKQFGGDEETFQKRLVDAGLTEQALRDQLAQQETIRYLIRQDKDAPAPVTEAEVKAFYDEHPQYWQEEEVYAIRYIVVPLPANAGAADKKQAQTKAEAARKRVAGGEDFEKVAKEHDANNPQAGSTQKVPSSGFSPELSKTIKSLKPGAVSPVQKIGDNYLVFQVVEIVPAKTVAFDEVKQTISKRLQAQREVEPAKRVIEQLRDSAKIQLNIPDPNKEAAAKPDVPATPEATEKK